MEDLARELGVEVKQVITDVQALAARCYYHPAGSGDDLQVVIEAERLSIWSKGEFTRPVRLTPTEALCVALSLRGGLEPGDSAARSGSPARSAPETQQNLRESLERQLALVGRGDLEGVVVAPDLAPDPIGIRAVVAEALRHCTPCRFSYLKSGAESPEVRQLEPWALVHAEGLWYAIGRDPEVDDVRVFRIDRMLGIELREGNYELPEQIDPTEYIDGAKLFFTQGSMPLPHALVRYSPSIARWIRERWEGEDDEDGAYRVRHPLGEPGWIIGHVLQYGAEAELLEPVELRGLVREIARRIAES